MEDERKKNYIPSLMEITKFPEEDVIRTSYVDDGYGGWEDEDAQPIGAF